MAGKKETSNVAISDKYRQFLHEDQIEWRHGGPPSYDNVNQLFEQGRTKIWAEGSLEETVQKTIKSWEMELSHKTRVKDFRNIIPEKFKLFVNGSLEETIQKSIKLGKMEYSLKTRVKEFKTVNPEKFKFFVNGKEGLSAEEILKLGNYNAVLKSSVPDEFKYYKADEESRESSNYAFWSAFPRGFAWEVIKVYTGPPVVTYKFRHWGFFEGPFKGHAPTGEMIQFYGVGIMKVDDSLRAENIEVYYDPAELFAGLLKGPAISESNIEQQGHDDDNITTQHCPYHN